MIKVQSWIISVIKIVVKQNVRKIYMLIAERYIKMCAAQNKTKPKTWIATCKQTKKNVTETLPP